MANTDAPFGFRPVRHLMGGLVRSNQYHIEGGLAANIFRGDPVKSTGTTKRVTVAAAGNTIVGVFDGCQYVNAQGEIVYSNYWPTGQTVKTGTVPIAYVFDDPNILFEVQVDGAFAEADVGQDADFVAGTGSTSTGNSAFELDSSDIGTGDNLHIYDYVRDGQNEVGTNARVLVLIKEHELRGALTEV